MRRRIRALSIALAAAACAAVTVAVVYPASAATNTIVNPGFESGLSGWSCPSVATPVTGHAHSGNYALQGAATASDNAQCTQVVSVSPSTNYTLSAYVTEPDRLGRPHAHRHRLAGRKPRGVQAFQ